MLTFTAKICIIDSGVWGAHPDLSSNIDQTIGLNVITNGTGFAAQVDDNYHGTLVAGTIAGVWHNGQGIAGLAMPNNVGTKPISCKFLNGNGVGLTTGAIACMSWCVSAGATIIHNSWNGGAYSQALHNEMAAHPNVLHVVAAGNNGQNMDESTSFNFPAADTGLPNMLVVGATAYNGAPVGTFYNKPWPSSNFGARTTHVFAPGDMITSTYWFPGTTPVGTNYVWRQASGTSFAAPHVTSAVALMQNINPKLLPAQIVQMIVASATKVPSLALMCQAGGQLNMQAAVQMALSSSLV